MTPGELLEALAEKGLLLHLPHPPAPGRLALTECGGAKVTPEDTATIRQHKPALLAYLERERAAADWLALQPRERRAAIARAADALRRKGTLHSDARLQAIETAQARERTAA